MNRPSLRLALTASAFAVWLVFVSACGGGGGGGSGGDVAGGDVDDSPASPPSDAPEDAPVPSPFEPDPPAGTDAAPGGGSGGGGNVDPDGGAEDGADMPIEPSASDNGPELQRPTGEGSDTADIAGLWDYSRVTSAGEDTVFVEIDAAGNVTEYDFQADAVGDGSSCHVVRRSSIASRGEGRYDIGDSSTLPGSRSVDDVLITADADEITFRYLGGSTDPQFSGQLTGVSESYPAAAGRDANDFAICEDG